jgi:hypothetical protein
MFGSGFNVRGSAFVRGVVAYAAGLMSNAPRFVMIGAFTTPIDAHLACSALKAAGIDARLSDNHLIEAQWMYSHAVGGVKVWVPEEDQTSALQLLDEAASVEPDETLRDDDAS